MNAIVSMFQGSRTMAKIEAEVVDAALAARRRLVQEIRKLQSEGEPLIAQLLQGIEKAALARAEAEGRFNAARAAEWAARRELVQLDIGLKQGIAGLESELRRSAPARIDQAIAAWRAQWEQVRSIGRTVPSINSPASAADVASDKLLAARGVALLVAIREAEHVVRLEALSAAQLEERLQGIDASIPSLHG